MGNPVRVSIKTSVVEVFLLETIIGINDRLHLKIVFYDVKPGENIALKVLRAKISGLGFHIEDRRKIAWFESYHRREIIGLPAGRRLVTPKMICTTDESRLLGIGKVFKKVFVEVTVSLRCLYKDKPNRVVSDERVAQSVPVDASLMMAYVNAVYGIPLWIIGITIDGAPPKSSGSDKK